MAAWSWIIIVVGVLMFFGVVYGFYTRTGSGINQRPHDPARGDDASGGAGPSRMSAAEDETEGMPDTHGTH